MLLNSNGKNGISQGIFINDVLPLNEIASYINILGNFCGKRDIQSLTQLELQNKYGIDQVDAMVLFGGSIICGGDILADGIMNKIAKKYIIVGGAGHTT